CFQRPYGIGGHPAGIPNAGQHARTGSTVSHGDVSRLVHSDAAHPAECTVWGICALLKDRKTTRPRGSPSQFVPAHSSKRISLGRAHRDGMVHYQGFMIPSKVPVSQAIHQAVAQGVDFLLRVELLNAGETRLPGRSDEHTSELQSR